MSFLSSFLLIIKHSNQHETHPKHCYTNSHSYISNKVLPCCNFSTNSIEYRRFSIASYHLFNLYSSFNTRNFTPLLSSNFTPFHYRFHRYSPYLSSNFSNFTPFPCSIITPPAPFLYSNIFTIPPPSPSKPLSKSL